MPNRLINEHSPYLLQHAHNPVDWYPWGDEAFERAKAEHKPVIVSIGYAACHWCHVMERESFEHAGVAEFMNTHFVCIKVDREEHPDVDHMYMDAVQAIGGSGGWPLNVFTTPERAPFYGGTYYPPQQAFNRPSWMQLLHRMVEIWHQQQDEVTLQATQMLQHLQQASQRFAGAVNAANEDTCRAIAAGLLKQADTEKGGFGNAPKFPGTMAISYLLEHSHFTGDKDALKHALHSLDAMIEGGIYDQLGGGFARYATDRNWLAPHFEKMLYDNALLILSLCDAYAITKEERYRRIIDETIAFAERELKDSTGGYYCAIDADSEGVEGKFYTWTWEEWAEVIGADDAVAATHFGVMPEGNWEETNILHVAAPIAQVAAAHGLPVGEVQQRIDEVKEQLLNVRKQRIRPITDDKSLLSWNALMNTALCKAGTTLDNHGYLLRAASHMEWMLKEFNIGGGLQHVWKKGVAKIPAKLDDYAYLVQAMLQLASANGDTSLILRAKVLTDVVVEQFSVPESPFFYYSAALQTDIPVRKIDLYDGATPSGNAVMAHNLWILGMCMERSEWVMQAKKMVENMSDTAARYGYSFSYWALVLQRSIQGMKTVVCTGSGALAAAAEMRSKYLPQGYLLASEKEISDLPILEKKYLGGGLAIFVCTEQACLAPVNSVHGAFSLIAERAQQP
ncbi:MAG: thioredoxin domain-containing protein [Bacteroidota bacterium]